MARNSHAGTVTEVAAVAGRRRGWRRVERALSVVAALAASTSPLTLAELGRTTGLYNSTVLRLLVSLERAGYIVRRCDGRYGLGAMAFRLGVAYERSHGLKTHLLPILQDLVQLGCESPSFHVRHDTERRLCLLRLDSHHATLDRVHAGDLLPLHRGAAGRVILAASAQTPHPSPVLASFGERDPACAGVACPVFGPNGMLVVLCPCRGRSIASRRRRSLPCRARC